MNIKIDILNPLNVILAKSLITIGAFLMPIQPLLISVGMFIILDTIVGVWRCKRTDKKVTSRKLSRIVQKMLVYQLVIITFFTIDKSMVNELMMLVLHVDYMLTKVVALILISIEVFSIDESFKLATGRGLYERLLSLISKAKTLKEDINELKG